MGMCHELDKVDTPQSEGVDKDTYVRFPMKNRTLLLRALLVLHHDVFAEQTDLNPGCAFRVQGRS